MTLTSTPQPWWAPSFSKGPLQGEPNLNPWWMVAYRRANQWTRRCLCGRWTPWGKRWTDRWQYLAGFYSRTAWDDIPAEHRAEWETMVWRIGVASVYRHTAAQRDVQARMSREIVEELRAEIAAEEC